MANCEHSMADELKKELRRAIWTIVVAGVLGISGIFFQTLLAQSKMQQQIDVLSAEQQLIRTKVDLVMLQQQRKVDRETMDNTFKSVNDKLDKIADDILEIYKNVKK